MVFNHQCSCSCFASYAVASVLSLCTHFYLINIRDKSRRVLCYILRARSRVRPKKTVLMHYAGEHMRYVIYYRHRFGVAPTHVILPGNNIFTFREYFIRETYLCALDQTIDRCNHLSYCQYSTRETPLWPASVIATIAMPLNLENTFFFLKKERKKEMK